MCGRRLSGDVGNAEFTAQHESLVEACAQLSDMKSGGSLTAIGVIDFANTGACVGCCTPASAKRDTFFAVEA
jgi:hypothetical protein